MFINATLLQTNFSKLIKNYYFTETTVKTVPNPFHLHVYCVQIVQAFVQNDSSILAGFAAKSTFFTRERTLPKAAYLYAPQSNRNVEEPRNDGQILIHLIMSVK